MTYVSVQDISLSIKFIYIYIKVAVSRLLYLAYFSQLVSLLFSKWTLNPLVGFRQTVTENDKLRQAESENVKLRLTEAENDKLN